MINITDSFDIIRGIDGFPDTNKVYITLKKIDRNAIKTLRSIEAAYGLHLYEINSEYLMSLFVKDIPSNPVNSIYKLLATALGIIVIASSIMIYNAFAMSLTERMKYLGMLSSVGATRRQKKASVYYEGFLLGIVGIPLGYLVGILGCIATLRFTGSLILNSNMLYGLNMSGMGHIPVRTHPVIVLAIILFSVLTIFISSFIPALKASRITAIEAIRQSNKSPSFCKTDLRIRGRTCFKEYKKKRGQRLRNNCFNGCFGYFAYIRYVSGGSV